MRTPLDNVIASLTLDATSPEGEAFVLTVQIGAPVPHPRYPEAWACPLAISPLNDRPPDIVGADSFQALSLALSLALGELEAFRDRGGELLMGGGTFPLEAYAFGTAIRRQAD